MMLSTELATKVATEPGDSQPRLHRHCKGMVVRHPLLALLVGLRPHLSSGPSSPTSTPNTCPGITDTLHDVKPPLPPANPYMSDAAFMAPPAPPAPHTFTSSRLQSQSQQAQCKRRPPRSPYRHWLFAQRLPFLLTALRSPLSALRSPLCPLRSPLSPPLSPLPSPLSALRSPFSLRPSPLCATPLHLSSPLPSPLPSTISPLR